MLLQTSRSCCTSQSRRRQMGRVVRPGPLELCTPCKHYPLADNFAVFGGAYFGKGREIGKREGSEGGGKRMVNIPVRLRCTCPSGRSLTNVGLLCGNFLRGFRPPRTAYMSALNTACHYRCIPRLLVMRGALVSLSNAFQWRPLSRSQHAHKRDGCDCSRKVTSRKMQREGARKDRRIASI